jgi:hypothetical protein
VRSGGVGAFVGGLVAGVSGAYGAAKLLLVRPIEKRLDDVENEVEETREIAEGAQSQAVSNRYTLEGDPNDPNYDGLAVDVAEMKETVEHVEEMMEEVRDDE